MEPEPYYDEFAHKEWGRLENSRTEYAVTLRAIADYLPKPPCSVVDIGGGPGRYAIELTRQGYTVTLLDLSRECLAIARDKASESKVSLARIIHANALDLGELDSASYGGVLLLGPLYHLLAESERVQSIREALRLLEPGGTLFAAFITRLAPFRYVANGDPAWLAGNREYARQLLETGIHDRPTQFANAYYARPDEIVPLMESCEVETVDLIGCEGIVAGHESRVNELSGDAWEAWVDLNYKLGKEPSLYGASNHLLYVGRKPVSTAGE